MPQHLRIVQSTSGDLRVSAAQEFITTRLDTGPAMVVSASRGAADDFARRIAASRPATLGLHRFSVTQLAARLAAPVLAADGLAPATYLGSEAVAARAAFDARRAGDLVVLRAGRRRAGVSPRARAYAAGAAARAGAPRVAGKAAARRR